MKAIDYVGYIGGIILGIQLIPQIIKVIKTQDSKSISIFYLLLNISGLILMSIYGFVNNDMPLYIPAIISTINSVLLLTLTIYYNNYYLNNNNIDESSKV